MTTNNKKNSSIKVSRPRKRCIREAEIIVLWLIIVGQPASNVLYAKESLEKDDSNIQID